MELKGTNHKEDVENESEDDDSDDPEVLVEEIEMLEDIVNRGEDSDAPVPVWESLADTEKTKSILKSTVETSPVSNASSPSPITPKPKQQS